MNRFSLREHAPSILVATLGGAFGVAVLQVTGVLAMLIAADDVTGASAIVALMLTIIAIVFIVIAVYVSSIVTANTFATIIAGRIRTLALLRLLGSTAASRRRAVAREGLLVGVIGAALGALLGTLLTFVGVRIGIGTGFLPDLGYASALVDPVVALPVVAVVLATWAASWVGSRQVLRVSPMQATGAATAASYEEAAGHRARNAVAITQFATGTALLALGMLVGLVSPLGVLVGVGGGILSFTGLVIGAQLVMPPALRLVGRMLGRSAPARLAAENALRYPERSSRTTIGLVIGVTLITMFAVVVASFEHMVLLAQQAQPDVYQGIEEPLTIVVVVFTALIGFSALIAAVGMVNNLSLSVLQRTRELGLLRALGFTGAQLRSMIRFESAQLTIAALLVGLVLGIGYGWAGAQSLLGAISGLVAPVVPLWLLAVVAIVAAALTVTASIAPVRRATRIAPVIALAAD